MKLTAMLAVLLVAVSWLGLGTTQAKADTPSGHIGHVWLSLRGQDDGGTGETAESRYVGLLQSLVNAGGHSLGSGLSETQTAGNGNTLIRMDLNLPDGETLRLWFNPRNMYLLGFTNYYGDTWAFNDSNLSSIMNAAALNGDGGLLPPLGQIHTLYFGGNYQSLSGAAGYGRDAMPISYNDLWNSVWQLQFGGNTASTARSLMMMIQATSEAVRFWDVYGVMTDVVRNPASHYNGLPSAQIELEQHWEQLSVLAGTLRAGGSGNVYVGPHVGNISTTSQIRSRVWTLLGQPGSFPPSDDWWHSEL